MDQTIVSDSAGAESALNTAQLKLELELCHREKYAQCQRYDEIVKQSHKLHAEMKSELDELRQQKAVMEQQITAATVPELQLKPELVPTEHTVIDEDDEDSRMGVRETRRFVEVLELRSQLHQSQTELLQAEKRFESERAMRDQHERQIKVQASSLYASFSPKN